MQYDGLDLIAEYSNTGTLTARVACPGPVPGFTGPGADEPLVQYAGASVSTRQWLLADERGSIVAVTDWSGAAIQINSYDEYGAPAPGNAGRFGYTGQVWLPETGLYHYKNRAYNPELGRFMQTDPIGVSGGMNLYAYVGGDPVNFVDPLGLLPDCDVEECIPVDGSRIECPSYSMCGSQLTWFMEIFLTFHFTDYKFFDQNGNAWRGSKGGEENCAPPETLHRSDQQYMREGQNPINVSLPAGHSFDNVYVEIDVTELHLPGWAAFAGMSGDYVANNVDGSGSMSGLSDVFIESLYSRINVIGFDGSAMTFSNRDFSQPISIGFSVSPGVSGVLSIAIISGHPNGPTLASLASSAHVQVVAMPVCGKR